MIFLQLFITFFFIGLFGFGGGYGMLSLIQGEVVHHWHWMTTSEFTDIVAISQMTPGPIGINSATYCGYTAVHNAGMGNAMAILGSITATFALVLPSLILMILISRMFMKYMNTSVVQSVFMGLRPAVVGLLGAATLLLMTSDNFSTPSQNPWQFWISTALFAATFVGTMYFKINPIRMILYCALAGLLLLY
ncbi:chromate transporter [Xylanibacter rodentium]|jgi:chromate transporter|uniref:Chromate transporter n=1 Tax=Xylanibacter rodentium TaxID=2736289 RepID=A0ABX2AWK3_9BACT|nr:chromate transporter [Xylanibacter rodentium]NPE12178.1 chromate transporter [Prevotella sp. PJ1A]NPE14466.1 chromate transporter [Xylanibacter rodentium]NPE40187.1 chromate transporter [Prevotella sp. PCJ2]